MDDRKGNGKTGKWNRDFESQIIMMGFMIW